jgi:hypothetical protein
MNTFEENEISNQIIYPTFYPLHPLSFLTCVEVFNPLLESIPMFASVDCPTSLHSNAKS